MSSGWIKLYRQLQDCWIWKRNEPFDKRSAWVDLLLLAMHNDKKMLIDNEIIVINRGSFMTSIVKLADRWTWSRGKVVRFLDVLESEQMLNTKRTPKGTLITIVKYDVFQGIENIDSTTVGTTDDTTDGTTVDATDSTTVGTADGTQNKNIKNIKNDKNVKNEKKEKKEVTNVTKKKESAVYYPNDELLNNAFNEFLVMRNKIKRPIATQQALTRMMNKIDKLSGGDNDLAVKILNQSTDHCWQDVYELKEGNWNSSYVACDKSNDVNANRQSQLDYLLKSIRSDEGK